MGKLKALLLTEGMHGMISQVEGMAKALASEFFHKIVKLNTPWNYIPPKFTPISDIVLKDKIHLSEKENPDLIISCGRKSVIPSIFLKKQNKPNTIETLQNEIWHYSSELETHTVETHIYRLRKKIREYFNDKNLILSNKDGYFIE